mgnify:CR=1 FL=1
MKKINYSDDILHRSTQILCHKDITFEKIFVPYWEEHFSKHKLNLRSFKKLCFAINPFDNSIEVLCNTLPGQSTVL